MPQHSNFFQRLVCVIERSLVDVPGTTVRESVLLEDQRTGEEREVDILIESSISGYTLRVAIECRNYRRKCDSTWIDQLIGKYADLSVDKVVAVSRRGFSKPAVEKARQHDIETLSLKSALNTGWDEMLSDATPGSSWTYWELLSRTITFRLSDPADGDQTDYYDEAGAADYWLYDVKHECSWHLPDFKHALPHSGEIRNRAQDIARKLESTLTRGDYSASHITSLRADVDYVLTDSADRQWPVDQVIIELEVRVGRSRQEKFEYRGQRVTIDTFKPEGEIMDNPTGWVTVQPKDTDGRGLIVTSYGVTDGEFGHLRLPLDLDDTKPENT